jgi:hypothetical protein
MTCALIVIIPAFLLLIDLYFLIMGYWFTASLCTTASRAAAQGPPNAMLTKSADIRVRQVIEDGFKSNNSTVHLDNYEVTEHITRLPTATSGGAVSGCVTVDLDASLRPPFCLKFVLPQNQISLHITHTSPYTYVQPALAKDGPPANPNPSLN